MTLTVHLKREDMSSVFNKGLGLNQSAKASALDDEPAEEQVEDKENRDKVREQSTAATSQAFAMRCLDRRDRKGRERVQRLERQVGQEEKDQEERSIDSVESE